MFEYLRSPVSIGSMELRNRLVMAPMGVEIVDDDGVANEDIVRYYEERGLIPPPRRSPSGYRLYGPTYVERIQFVKRAQELGFTLSEAGGLLEVGLDAPEGGCGDVRAEALAKLDDVEAKLRDLEAIRDALRALADACPGAGPRTECPILDTLRGA